MDDRPVVNGRMNLIWAWSDTVPAWPVNASSNVFYARHKGDGNGAVDFYGGFNQQVPIPNGGGGCGAFHATREMVSSDVRVRVPFLLSNNVRMGLSVLFSTICLNPPNF